MMNPVPWLQMTNMISYQGLVRTFPKRLVMNIALDFQEKYPSMTDEQAMTAALGYCERTYGQA